MNLLPFATNTLVKRLPIYSTRTNTIKYLLALNVGLYALYQVSPGPTKLTYRRAFVIESTSAQSSLLFCHFGYTTLPSLLFNGAILYTIGNYHIQKYGRNHFLRLYGLGLLAGAALAGYNARTNRNQYVSGGIAGTGVLLGYNIFKNP